MTQITQKWVKQPLVRVTIKDNSGNSYSFKSRAFHHDGTTDVGALSFVSPVAKRVDPWTTAQSIESTSIGLVWDDYVTQMLQSIDIMKRNLVTVFLDNQSRAVDADGDFVPSASANSFDYESTRLFDGYVQDVKAQEGLVILECEEAMGFFADWDIYGFEFAGHPLEVAKELFNQSHIKSTIAQAASWAYDIDTTRSHWRISSANELSEQGGLSTAGNKTNLYDLMSSLGMVGDFYVKVNKGVSSITFEPVATPDEGDSVDYTIPDGAVSDYEYLGGFTSHSTDVAVQFGLDMKTTPIADMVRGSVGLGVNASDLSINIERKGGDEPGKQIFYHGNADARQDATIPDYMNASEYPRINHKHFDLPWVTGRGAVLGKWNGSSLSNIASGDAAPFTIRLIGPFVHGFCGTSGVSTSFSGDWSANVAAQPANAKASSSRLLHVMIGGEIFEVDGVTIKNDAWTKRYFYDDTYGIDDGMVGVSYNQRKKLWRVPTIIDIDVSARAQYGTSAIDIAKADYGVARADDTFEIQTAAFMAYDYTIPIQIAEKRIRRFSQGAPKIKFETSLEYLSEFDVFDLVQFSGDVSLPYYRVGTTDITTEVFEVVSREVFPLEGRVVWEAVWNHEASVSYSWTSDYAYTGRGSIYYISDIARDQTAMSPHIANGMTLANSSGLNIEIADGVFASQDGKFRQYIGELDQTDSLTVKNNETTWIIIDTATGGIRVEEGSTEPTLYMSSEVFVGKAVASGGSVTLTDLRKRRPYNLKDLFGQNSLTAHSISSDFLAEQSLLANSSFGFWQYRQGDEDDA